MQKNWTGGESNINRYNINLPVWSHHLQDEQYLLYFRRVESGATLIKCI
jgi:hypothetical protein